MVAQPELDYYFPSETRLNDKIPTPESILGFQLGERHVSHDQLVKYMYTLAEKSDRIQIEKYGWTYEYRPLLLLTISSAENILNIVELREKHAKLSDPEVSDKVDISDIPAVTWLGYSVHGNESSGANASLLVAYYLAACESNEINEILEDNIILIDPSINPDGLNRFSQWVNQYKSNVDISDPNNIEHNEPWPRGRTNHYWFDLNRDWLPLQHVESKSRIKQFHKWKPNIVTDHHEMGSNSTFFFQPGIPSRNNPNTPKNTYDLTAKIAEYHAKALDDIGSLYYARESFDDFYYGKGSTYPDVNGGIGILFEQASSRGHIRQTDNGLLEFPFTIRNQFTVSLSTIKSANELREDLLIHQKKFYTDALSIAKDDPVKAFVFDGGNDKSKTYQFIKLIQSHLIDVFEISSEIHTVGHNYKKGSSYIVPVQQKQYRLIKAIFEQSTDFKDSLFYDVSAWTLPLAFDMQYGEILEKSYKKVTLGEKLQPITLPEGKVSGKSEYAYLMRWNDYYAPKALYQLFKNNINVKVSLKPFTAIEGETFEQGTLLIPVQGQKQSSENIFKLINKIAKSSNEDFYPVSSGYSLSGIDLGSPNMATLEKPKAMILVGDGISSYEAGEIWHLLDYRFEIPLSLVPVNRIDYINLSRYNTLIMVSGNYSSLSESTMQKITRWVQDGGTIIGIKGGSSWLSKQDLAQLTIKKTKLDSAIVVSYGDMANHLGAQEIGGAIFNSKLDLTHPLCFGYPDDRLSMFKNGKLFFEKSTNPYNNPVVFENNSLQSGYISKENYQTIHNTSGVIISAIGRGKSICFSDDPNFRAFWYGSNRLFFNAIFFGKIINLNSVR